MNEAIIVRTMGRRCEPRETGSAGLATLSSKPSRCNIIFFSEPHWHCVASLDMEFLLPTYFWVTLGVCRGRESEEEVVALCTRPCSVLSPMPLCSACFGQSWHGSVLCGFFSSVPWSLVRSGMVPRRGTSQRVVRGRGLGKGHSWKRWCYGARTECWVRWQWYPDARRRLRQLYWCLRC